MRENCIFGNGFINLFPPPFFSYSLWVSVVLPSYKNGFWGRERSKLIVVSIDCWGCLLFLNNTRGGFVYLRKPGEEHLIFQSYLGCLPLLGSLGWVCVCRTKNNGHFCFFRRYVLFPLFLSRDTSFPSFRCRLCENHLKKAQPWQEGLWNYCELDAGWSHVCLLGSIPPPVLFLLHHLERGNEGAYQKTRPFFFFFFVPPPPTPTIIQNPWHEIVHQARP